MAKPDPTGRPEFQTVDPSNGRAGRRYQGHTTEEALGIARAAHIAFRDWRRNSFEARAGLMRQAAAELRRRQAEFAETMCGEMGKTLADGRAEVEKCAVACDWYADHAERLLEREPVEFGVAKASVVFRPLGTILAVMPWNFPFWQVFRFAAPTLMAGNTA